MQLEGTIRVACFKTQPVGSNLSVPHRDLCCWVDHSHLCFLHLSGEVVAAGQGGVKAGDDTKGFTHATAAHLTSGVDKVGNVALQIC